MKNKRNHEYISYVLILLVAFSVVFLIDHQYYQQNIEKHRDALPMLAKEQRILTDMTLNQLEAIVLASRGIAETLDIDSNGAELNEANIRASAVIRQIVDNSPLIHSIYFVSEKTGNGLNKDKMLRLEEIGADLRRRLWYIRAKEKPGVNITPVYEDRNTGKDTFTVCIWIENKDKFIGVAALDIFLDDWNKVYWIKQNLKKEQSFIVDAYGTIISHYTPSLIGVSINQHREKADDTYDELWENYLNHEDPTEVEYTSSFEQKIIAYAIKSSNYDWVNISTLNLGELAEDNRKYLISLISISIFIVLLAYAAVYYYYRRSYLKDSQTSAGTKERFIGKLTEITKNNEATVCLFNLALPETARKATAQKLILEFSRRLIRYGQGAKNVFRLTENTFCILFAGDRGTAEEDRWGALYEDLSGEVYYDDEARGYRLPVLCSHVTMNQETGLEFISKLESWEESLQILQNKGITGIIPICRLSHEIDNRADLRKKRDEVLSALREDRIVPFYQPIMELKTSALHSYEVLMRIWDGEQYCAPFQFVQFAEETNMIKDLDMRVLTKALAYKKKADKEDIVKLSFNLSAKVLNDDTFLENATAIIDQNSFKRENICWEITESAKIDQMSTLTDIILKYKQKGYRFSIDDFGTGFSSMSYLQHIPADYAKIDGSFITKITSSAQSFFLVSSLVNLAMAYNMQVVAEYVENEEIAQKIQETNILYGQGFHLAEPSPAFLD